MFVNKGDIMYLKKDSASFEKSIFNNRDRTEHIKFINDYIKHNNLDYTVNILQFDATGELKTFTVEECNKTKDILDKNYTYVIKKAIKDANRDAFDTELSLYVSIYKHKSECKLVVYKTNRKVYYNLYSFPKKYISIVDSMFDVINLFRL